MPQTIDEMVDQLADIRAKKAELEKQEQATIKALREKFKAHKERLAKMGVALEEPPAKSAEGTADLPSKIDIPPLDAPRASDKK
jgi:DNA-binding protein H-NS